MKTLFVFSLLLSLLAAPVRAGGTAELKVKGMVCSFCAQGLEKRFIKRPEVEAVKVNLETKTVALTFKDGKSIADEELKTAVNEAGYDLVEVKRSGEKP